MPTLWSMNNLQCTSEVQSLSLNHTYRSCGLCSIFLFFQQAYIQDKLVFETGLCAVLHPRDHHKIKHCTQICTQCPIHDTHFLCRVNSCGFYSSAAFMQRNPPKREAFIQDRLIFKGGFYTRLHSIMQSSIDSI